MRFCKCSLKDNLNMYLITGSQHASVKFYWNLAARRQDLPDRWTALCISVHGWTGVGRLCGTAGVPVSENALSLGSCHRARTGAGRCLGLCWLDPRRDTRVHYMCVPEVQHALQMFAKRCLTVFFHMKDVNAMLAQDFPLDRNAWTTRTFLRAVMKFDVSASGSKRIRQR